MKSDGNLNRNDGELIQPIFFIFAVRWEEPVGDQSDIDKDQGVLGQSKVKSVALTRRSLQTPDENVHVSLAGRFVQVKVCPGRRHLVSPIGERLFHVILLQWTFSLLVTRLGHRSSEMNRPVEPSRCFDIYFCDFFCHRFVTSDFFTREDQSEST